MDVEPVREIREFSRDASRARAIGEECGRANDRNERVTSEYVASVAMQCGAAITCAFERGTRSSAMSVTGRLGTRLRRARDFVGKSRPYES